MSENSKIVVVDDDKSCLDLTTNMLRRFIRTGSVSSFQSGSSAWEHIKRSHVDILVSDVEMKDMGGLELLSEVKKAFPRVRCVMISGNPSRKKAAMQLGADAFLQKPFGARELIEAVGIGSFEDLEAAF